MVPLSGHILGFTPEPRLQPLSNFNIGLFCQQAGMTLDQTLRIAGRFALLFSSNSDHTKPYGLRDDNRNLITEGYKRGASGVFGATVRYDGVHDEN